ncbi:hypothetical protein RPHASCH2410_PD01210 (plasmid) [Rhizobium phaseoli Ch24-10]|nr:hypothetical protein RPHASCH2410_PD01210 [Rhizobium phaseoli Ch24-10]
MASIAASVTARREALSEPKRKRTLVPPDAKSGIADPRLPVGQDTGLVSVRRPHAALRRFSQKVAIDRRSGHVGW